MSATTYSSKYCGWVVHVIGKGLRKSIKKLACFLSERSPATPQRGEWQMANGEQRTAANAYCPSGLLCQQANSLANCGTILVVVVVSLLLLLLLAIERCCSCWRSLSSRRCSQSLLAFARLFIPFNI